MEMGQTPPARLASSPVTLLRSTLGGPVEVMGKAQRLGSALAGYAAKKRLDDRLERLRACGVLDAIPTRIQLAVGGYDMLRFWISPAAAEYYKDKGIDFGFHQ